MITNNFNKELRGISDALRDLGYTDSTIGLRQRYWKEYCVYHGSLDIDESSMDKFLLVNYVIQRENINISKRQYEVRAALRSEICWNTVAMEKLRVIIRRGSNRKKGLLCMGPDCGVANINGAALVLASINARGPFGICGASGTGIQHVAAILHAAGTGVSQTIGTGGNDLKNPVGGIMMLMGIDALEADMDTKYIALISRRPGDEVLPKVLNRISECRKPVVVFFMGCERELIESAGAVWAENLDDCAQKCLTLISKEYPLESDEELSDRAAEAVKMLGKEQKYVRGAFSGGTYMDEAMQTLAEKVGPIYSNSPLKEDWRLLDSHVSVENTCIDYGEEEFTLGRPHPAIDPGVRQPAILREAADPETAVILFSILKTAEKVE